MSAPPVVHRPAFLEPTFEALVPMADGVRLATHVYLPTPKVGRASWPFALLRTPYGKAGVLDAAPELAGVLVEHGIGLVAQDVRGKFESEGTATPFSQEAADGLATVQWVCEQRWSDSRIFSIGDSYAGFTAWCVACSGHHAVRGAVTRVTTTDIVDGWMYRQGIFRLQMNAAWTTFAFGGRGLPSLPSVDPDWSVRPLRDLDHDGADPSYLEYVIRHAPPSAEWADHCLGPPNLLSKRVDVPVLHRGGWWDLMSRGQLRDWDISRRRARGQVLLMAGSDHLSNHFGAVPDASPKARVDQLTQLYAEEVLPFARSVLDGVAPPSQARWELVHDGWHESSTWPPASTQQEVLYLVNGSSAAFGPEGGALSRRSDAIRQIVAWVHDPNDLVPSLETFVWGTLPELPDERDVQIRDDVLTFSAVPAATPIDIAGCVEVNLLLEASASPAQVVATLCDVFPDGRCVRLVEGAAPLRLAATAAEVTVDLGPLAYRIQPGHCLRLAIAGSSFPRYIWATGTDEDPWEATAGTPVQLLLQIGSRSYVRFDVKER